MSDRVILIELAAALLHVVWNAVVKSSNDKSVSMVAVKVFSKVVTLCVVAMLRFAR